MALKILFYEANRKENDDDEDDKATGGKIKKRL